MDPLPLGLIGWLYTLLCAGAIAIGGWIIVAVHLRGDRAALAARVAEDTILFGIWLLGLAGGIGVLLGRGWSRPALELFCWAFSILLLLNAWTRWRAAPPPRQGFALSLILFVVPVLAFTGATILTLRSETALRALPG
ncbi:MAG: hypothetical protein FJY51_10525 [Betaproteobacteria bacterium]|nr:hypothetical protein [Betaproteobacteria bacterium]